jgi:hypothetical protein
MVKVTRRIRRKVFDCTIAGKSSCKLSFLDNFWGFGRFLRQDLIPLTRSLDKSQLGLAMESPEARRPKLTP